jgi:hypothetical protein
MSDGLALRFLGEAESARCLLDAAAEYATEPVLEPGERGWWRIEDKRPSWVDRDQLERLEPDLERALADDLAETLADSRPVVAIGKARHPETSPNLVEINAY